VGGQRRRTSAVSRRCEFALSRGSNRDCGSDRAEHLLARADHLDALVLTVNLLEAAHGAATGADRFDRFVSDGPTVKVARVTYPMAGARNAGRQMGQRANPGRWKQAGYQVESGAFTKARSSANYFDAPNPTRAGDEEQRG